MNVASDFGARNPLPALSLDILPFHIASWRRDTLGMSMTEKGILVELKAAACERGGSLPNDDRFLARAVGIPMAVWRKAREAILRVARIVGDMIIFDGLVTELNRFADIREKRVSAGKARHSVHQKNEQHSAQKNATQKAEKRNDFNGGTSAHAEQMTPQSTSTSTGSKDSPYSPQGGRGFGFPDLGDVLRATAEPDTAPASEAAKPFQSEKRARARAATGDAEFEAFWTDMPDMARQRASKPETLKQWKLLTDEERAQVRAVLPVWAEDGKYAKGAHRWLKLRMWESLIGRKAKPERTKEDRECEMMY